MARGRFQVSRCRIEGVEAVSADTAHAFGRHIHDQFGIGVILRGAQTSASGRGPVEAEEGDVITVNPGEVHDGAPLGPGGRTWRMLYFDADLLAGLMPVLADGARVSGELAHPVLRDPAAASGFLALFRALTDPLGGRTEIEAREALLLLLARLVDLHRPDRVPDVPRTIAQARARIDDDPAAQVSLAELAAISGQSEFQLLRGFARAVGLTPHAYLVQRRLQTARRRIAAGAPLAIAAQEAGFADQSHMTRLFVRTYGMTPGRLAAAGR
jgi:AraC-like DNA-binding protein